MEFTSITPENIVSIMSKKFVTHGLPFSLRTDHNFSLITSQGNLEKKALWYTDRLHPYVMATGQSGNRKEKVHYSKRFAYCQAERGVIEDCKWMIS